MTAISGGVVAAGSRVRARKPLAVGDCLSMFGSLWEVGAEQLVCDGPDGESRMLFLMPPASRLNDMTGAAAMEWWPEASVERCGVRL